MWLLNNFVSLKFLEDLVDFNGGNNLKKKRTLCEYITYYRLASSKSGGFTHRCLGVSQVVVEDQKCVLNACKCFSPNN